MAGGGEAGLPRLRGGVGSEPLGVICESVSACTPLCQGMAAGMERRGPVIVYGLRAPTTHEVLCAPALHAALRHPLCLLAGHPECWGLHRTPEVPGLVLGSAGAGALRISRWEEAGLLSMGSVKPAETAAQEVAPTSKRLCLDGQPKCFWPPWESSHTST